MQVAWFQYEKNINHYGSTYQRPSALFFEDSPGDPLTLADVLGLAGASTLGFCLACWHCLRRSQFRPQAIRFRLGWCCFCWRFS